MIATVLIDQGPGLPKLAMLDPAVTVRSGQADRLHYLLRCAADLEFPHLFPARWGESPADKLARYDRDCFKVHHDLRLTGSYLIEGYC